MALIDSRPEVLGQHDRDGNTALHQMASHGFEQIIEQVLCLNPRLAFLKNNASLYPVHTAILNQQSGSLKQLLKIDGVATLSDSKERVPLHYAARYGTPDMVDQCCLATRDIDITDKADKTPLIWAAETGNQDALEFLLAKGATVTAADYEGYTILHHAVIAQNESMVRWIVANTPNELLNQPDAEGHSPLFHAQNSKNRDIEEILLNKGAINAQTMRY
jgi:ankyrin repeat protein